MKYTKESKKARATVRFGRFTGTRDGIEDGYGLEIEDENGLIIVNFLFDSGGDVAKFIANAAGYGLAEVYNNFDKLGKDREAKSLDPIEIKDPWKFKEPGAFTAYIAEETEKLEKENPGWTVQIQTNSQKIYENGKALTRVSAHRYVDKEKK